MADHPTVPLLDLKAQFATIRDEVYDAIREVVESQMFVLGPTVAEFERETAAYCGTHHAVGCASGSDAIMLALMALGIGPGDEVVCPSYTFFATAGYITRVGATPVFCDIDPVTYNADPASLRAACARCGNLKAIMPVHLFGQCADMDAMLAIGAEFGIPVVQDAAQAIGARDATGAAAGSRGALGCFSFFPTKNLGGFGDGGLVTTNDAEIAKRIAILRMHGMEPKYHHQFIGVNSRLDALQAAVLRVKLKYLDQWHDGRRANAAHYDRRFREAGASTTAEGWEAGDLPLLRPSPPPGGTQGGPDGGQPRARHIYNQYVIRVPAALRDDLRAFLTERGIGTEIYYPIPLHMQACFGYLGYQAGDFPASEAAARETIALPIFAELTDEQLDHVADSVIEFVGRSSRAAIGAST